MRENFDKFKVGLFLINGLSMGFLAANTLFVIYVLGIAPCGEKCYDLRKLTPFIPPTNVVALIPGVMGFFTRAYSSLDYLVAYSVLQVISLIQISGAATFIIWAPKVVSAVHVIYFILVGVHVFLLVVLVVLPMVIFERELRQFSPVPQFYSLASKRSVERIKRIHHGSIAFFIVDVVFHLGMTLGMPWFFEFRWNKNFGSHYYYVIVALQIATDFLQIAYHSIVRIRISQRQLLKLKDMTRSRRRRFSRFVVITPIVFTVINGYYGVNEIIIGSLGKDVFDEGWWIVLISGIAKVALVALGCFEVFLHVRAFAPRREYMFLRRGTQKDFPVTADVESDNNQTELGATKVDIAKPAPQHDPTSPQSDEKDEQNEEDYQCAKLRSDDDRSGDDGYPRGFTLRGILRGIKQQRSPAGETEEEEEAETVEAVVVVGPQNNQQQHQQTDDCSPISRQRQSTFEEEHANVHAGDCSSEDDLQQQQQQQQHVDDHGHNHVHETRPLTPVRGLPTAPIRLHSAV